MYQLFLSYFVSCIAVTKYYLLPVLLISRIKYKIIRKKFQLPQINFIFNRDILYQKRFQVANTINPLNVKVKQISLEQKERESIEIEKIMFNPQVYVPPRSENSPNSRNNQRPPTYQTQIYNTDQDLQNVSRINQSQIQAGPYNGQANNQEQDNNAISNYQNRIMLNQNAQSMAKKSMNNNFFQQNTKMDSGNQQQNEEFDFRDNKTFAFGCRWIHIGLVVIYGVISVVLSSILIGNFPNNTPLRHELSLMIDNWNLETIEDLQVVILTPLDITNQAPARCPSGYMPFFQFEDYSTLLGCNCLTSTQPQRVINIGNCTPQMLSAGCKKILPIIKPIGFQWITPDGLTVFSICAKRTAGSTYSANGATATCQKQCGGTTPDTVFCVASGQLCPVNFIQIGLVPPVILGLKTQAIGAYFLYFSAQGPGSPIVETRITKGTGVCLDNKVANLNPTSATSVLLDRNTTALCTVTDSRFISLSSITEQQAMQVNYMTNSYISIPDFSISPIEVFGLYSRSIIPITATRKVADIQAIKDIHNNFYMIYNACISLLVISCLYFLLVSCLYTLISGLNLISKSYTFKKFLFDMNESKNNSPSSIFKRLWLKISVSVIHFINIVVTFILTANHYIKLNNLSQGTVGEIQTVNLFSGLQAEFSTKIMWYVTSSFIYFMVLIAIEMLALVPLCSKKLQEDTTVHISKKYLPDPSSSIAQQQSNLAQKNPRGQELAEYQTHNIYSGIGINTTIHPYMQQMSVLGPEFNPNEINRSFYSSTNGNIPNAKGYSTRPIVPRVISQNQGNSEIKQNILDPRQYQQNGWNVQVRPQYSNGDGFSSNSGAYRPPNNVIVSQLTQSPQQESNYQQYIESPEGQNSEQRFQKQQNFEHLQMEKGNYNTSQFDSQQNRSIPLQNEGYSSKQFQQHQRDKTPTKDNRGKSPIKISQNSSPRPSNVNKGIQQINQSNHDENVRQASSNIKHTNNHQKNNKQESRNSPYQQDPQQRTSPYGQMKKSPNNSSDQAVNQAITKLDRKNKQSDE